MIDTLQQEIIELALPANAAYVSTARLTASSIANRMNFGIEQIQDIKAAVSEACTFLIRQKARIKSSAFNVTFTLKDEELLIMISAETINSDDASITDEYGIIMLKALMDSVEVSQTTNGEFRIEMFKFKSATNSFEV